MRTPTHTVVATPGFTAQLNKLDVSESEQAAIYDAYSSDPEFGAIVKTTGGLRKGRVAKDETGKSGGYRVFSFFANERYPVFLLWIIDKSKDDTLTDAQEKAFRSATSQLKKGVQMMDTEDFSGIMAGLGDALAYVKGDRNRGRVVAGPDVRAIRKAIKLSQEAFANTFHLKLGTVRDWEQGRRAPDSGSATLLKMIEADPKGVQKIMAKVS